MGIEWQKERFYANIDRFLSGRPALDVLLWGERGSGKSSLAATVPHRFPTDGYRMVSVRERDIGDLSRLLDTLDDDGSRWIILFDDLSFNEKSADYHELKVFLEGGLEARPKNTLAVATSNRRHLVAEEDGKNDRRLHPGDETAEAISLADRFGLSLGFYSFDQEKYLEAVKVHLGAFGDEAPLDEWRSDAIRWAMERGIRSGRSAAQFARFYAKPSGRVRRRAVRDD